MVRCKFKCESVTNFVGGSKVVMTAVHSGSPENEKFFKYTPSASLEMQTVNPEAAKKFVPGKEYYLELIEAEDNSKTLIVNQVSGQ